MKKLYTIIAILLCINIYAQEKSFEEPSQSNSKFDTAIAYLSERWQLTNLQPFIYPSVFDHYIARAYSSVYHEEVVLKICESNDECKALQYLQSDGVVNLIDYDHEHYALLLQCIPSQGCLADFLQTHDDSWIINSFVHLFKKIHASPKTICTDDFKTMQEIFSILHTHQFTKIPKKLLQKAMQIYERFITSNEPQYLLHSDLHCSNILKFEDDFIAIDPWASVGPLEYEAASFLSSPTDFILAQNNPQHLLQNRLDTLTDLLQLNKKLLQDCAFMRVILLACLCEMRNKNDDWIHDFIEIAEIIDKLNNVKTTDYIL